MREIWGRDEKLGSILRKQTPDPGSRYRWSRFVLRFEVGTKSFLYNTLTRQCLEEDRSLSETTPASVSRSGDAPSASALCSFARSGDTAPLSARSGDALFSFQQIKDDPELLALFEEYFLVPEGKDEAAFFQSLYQLMRTFAKKKGFTGYTILPTTGCNARCIYCYEEGRPRVSMDSGTVNRVIRYILETRRKDAAIHLSWFGGEPLLRPDVIDTVCRAMGEEGVDFKSSIVTNGSLIDDGLLERMTREWRLKKAQVSMDCAEEEYIARKSYARYENTYWKVIGNIEKLARRGITVVVRCNVDEGNVEQIPAFLSDLGGAIEEKENISVYFAPLFETGNSPEFVSFYQKIQESRELAARAGFVPVLKGKLRSFRANHCMADHPSGYAVIAPDGDLYTCEHCEPGTSHGNIFRGTTRPDLLRRFLEPGNVREKCRDCALLPECTSFSMCPDEGPHCKEIKTDEMLYALRRMVQQRQDLTLQEAYR